MTRDELLRLRCTDADWDIWQARAQEDAVWRQTRAHRRAVETAKLALEEFASQGEGYVSVSWGKDSCAVLLLAAEVLPTWPVVHVRIQPVENPDCVLVRDAYLRMFPRLAARYVEIVVRCVPKYSTGRYDTNLAYAQGFAQADRAFGGRYVSGVRSDESAVRRLTVGRNGLVSKNTCRPIGRWNGSDVFASLVDAPLHPAYPCSQDGVVPRERVRVNNLWGLYAEAVGRAEWEQRYYRDALRNIRLEHQRDCGKLG